MRSGFAFSLQQEGFALDWSPTEEGRLATGDCGNCINVTQKVEGGWATDPVPFVGHVGSVEDLQWSPTESSVSAFAFLPVLTKPLLSSLLLQGQALQS